MPSLESSSGIGGAGAGGAGGEAVAAGSVEAVCSLADVAMFVLDEADRLLVRCAFSGRNLQSMMPLTPTPARLKLLHACYQCHSSRVATFLPVYTENCVQTLKDMGFEEDVVAVYGTFFLSLALFSPFAHTDNTDTHVSDI
jgi:hypothetical protein